MLSFLRKLIPNTHPIRLIYHRVLAVVAAFIYRFPAEKLVVVGVTGTNGKTTTVNLMTNVLGSAGYKTGMTSTIRFRIGDEMWSNTMKQTTMGPFGLQKILRKMVDEGCTHAVLEVSSHAITQSRIWGVNIDVAVYTNVTPEHRDYHGSFEAYLEAKGGLFKHVAEGRRKKNVKKVLVLNRGDEHCDFFDQYVADEKMFYGLKKGDVLAKDIEKRADSSSFVLQVGGESVDLKVSLPGEFNIYNCLAVAAACLGLGLSLSEIKKGLEASASVPGRYEAVDAGQKFKVIVDYAHDTVALKNLLSMYRELTPGRLLIAFGATGGGRDSLKRPEMGKIADEFADCIVLTNDDPYWEDEMGILDQIGKGIKRELGENFWKIPDRREAISLVLGMAKEGDTVLVAGKGCEEVQVLKEGKVEWNDKDVIMEILGARKV